MLRAVLRDAIEMTRASSSAASELAARGSAANESAARGTISARTLARSVFMTDSFPVMVLTRVRETCRRWHVPGVNRVLRYTQMALFGIEIGRDVELGPGVFFVHTLGTVVGGNARLGARVRLMGSNTIGTAKDNGCPIIEDDVEIGCGARILGPVRIGARAQIAANAVVLQDVPADALAIGVPAVVRPARGAGVRAS